MLSRKTGDCWTTLNVFLAVSFPFYCYITFFFFMSEMLLKGCFYVFDIPKDKPSWEPRIFILGFVCLFRFWLFIISWNENKLQNVRIHLGVEISSSSRSEFDHKTGWIISLIGLTSHTGLQRTGHHSSPSPERFTALVSGSLNLGWDTPLYWRAFSEGQCGWSTSLISAPTCFQVLKLMAWVMQRPSLHICIPQGSTCAWELTVHHLLLPG